MNIRLEIKRQRYGEKEGYTEVFNIDASQNDSVLNILERLNSSDALKTADGKTTEPIAFEMSCRQSQCGGCAMVINGIPALACESFVKELCKKKAELTLAPLTKFPVICDLKVDRSEMHRQIREMRMWLEEIKNVGAFQKKHEAIYESGSCLMCGCCLEVCPNYYPGRNFYGAAAMHIDNRLLTMEKNRKKRKELIKAMRNHGTGGCSKSLGCQRVCPQKLPLDAHISSLYRNWMQK